MQKKNLLYIFADQWRYHAMGCVGEDKVFTPHMDAFAKESMSFTNAISTYPLCSPHRASLMTGKHPLECGFWTNCKSGLAISPTLAPQEICFSDVLKQNGYDTAYIGKWHLDSSDLNFSSDPKSGAVEWDAYTPKGERRHGFDFWHSYGAMDKHLQPHYWEDTLQKLTFKAWSPEHEREVLEHYLSNVWDKEKPFAAVLSWNPPHPPYDQVPSTFIKRYDHNYSFRPNVPEHWREDQSFQKNFTEYYAAITGLDEQFGRIVQYLKVHNLYDSTTIILSSDHGDCMGSHGIYGKNIWYEESIRIPFYIKDGDLGKGQNDCLFESRDHAPTILAMLKQQIPETMTGTPFGNPDRSHAFLCMIPGMPQLVQAYAEKGLDAKCFGWRGLRSNRYTFIIDNGIHPDSVTARYLYDNVEDTYQLHPMMLAPGDERCKQYTAILKEMCKSQRDPFLFGELHA